MRNRKRERGGSVFEFGLILTFLVPLLVGTGVMGINMVREQQTIQLAREAGYLYARGFDFSLPGNQTILTRIGAPIGLSATAGQGNSEVIFTALIYVDDNECGSQGFLNSNGVPTSACTNFNKWVFAQRLVIGNSSIRSSSTGSPLTNTPTGVTPDSVTGIIPASQYVTAAGAVANFNLVNPYHLVDGVVTGLPSKQFLYITETAATTYAMYPYTASSTYSYGLF